MNDKGVKRGRADFGRRLAAVAEGAASAGLLVGLTPAEVAARFRVSPDKVRAWIKSGLLRAVNTADAGCGKPRFVILPEHLAEFERSRSATPAPKPPRRRRREGRDFYPD